MVPDISRGARTYGLLAYLYGPGRRDEHTDPHMVASWNSALAPDPGRDPSATLSALRDRLDLPMLNLPADRRPVRHVWHCPVRTAPGDRELTDDEWGLVARRIVHAAGIAEEGDPLACRWIAVRHADDHIHIVATLVRQDGRRPRHHRDAARVQAECRKLEAELGLQILNKGDGTAAQRPTSAERFKAKRRGLEQTARETLREAVRQAVAGTASEEEFFSRLTEAGLRVKRRLAPSGVTLGYTVALPGDRNRDNRPVWFSGSKLAADLSLPKLRQRWPAPDTLDVSSEEHTVPAAGEAYERLLDSRRRASAITDECAELLEDAGSQEVAARLTGAGEILDALAATTHGDSRPEIRAAAREFERATRFHARAERAELRAVRRAARDIIHAGAALGQGEDGGTTAMLLSSLVLLAVATARWHAARGHAQQAAAARRSAEHLRSAYRSAAAPTLTALRRTGELLTPRAKERVGQHVRSAMPALADTVLEDPGWDALAAQLDRAEGMGEDAEALLRRAVSLRELDSAESMAGVLVWRIRRLSKSGGAAGGSTTVDDADVHMAGLGLPQGEPAASATSPARPRKR